MPNYKFTIEYDGTRYNGWQLQTNSNHTIQGTIEKVGQKIFEQKIRMIGSGRTDSGVHASAQVASSKINTKMDEDEIRNAFNAHLPTDIAIIKVEKVSDQFHAQFNAKLKTYRYTVLNRPTRPALRNNACLHYPHKLNLRLMRQAAKALIGRHDFKSFQATDAARKDKSSVRRIKRIEIKKQGDLVLIDIEADGFLYKMARNIVGLLLKAGSAKLEKGSIKKILAQRDRTKAPQTAKACGLMLIEVTY